MAWHLARVIRAKNHVVRTIISRNKVTGREIADDVNAAYTGDFRSDNSKSDFVILAVNDSSLPEVVNKINGTDTIVLHTSGSIGMDIFDSRFRQFGVLYPFQTLTRKAETDFSVIPLCIEASDKNTFFMVNKLAGSLSNKIHSLDSEKRKILHIAGVLSNNSMNHLIARTFDYLEKHGIDKNILMPLLRETIKKLEFVPPREAQTGPARRKNTEIIEAHKKMLENEPQLKKLYSLISDSIIAYYS
jgi:predicted short-subunit dehydrogenase-like oxidoreductase (DUF2520 family)